MTRALQITSGNFHFETSPAFTASMLETNALSQHFSENLSDFKSISYMMAAGGMGRFTAACVRNVLGRSLSFFTPILSETVGVGTEAAAFTLFTNPSQSAFAHHFTNFSVLRMAGFLGRSSNALLQHSFESAGMVFADQLTGINVEKSLSQRLVEASVFGIQNRISMGAAHVLFPIAFHHFGSIPLKGHKNFRDLIEPLLQRRTSPGFLAAKIGLATFIHESFAAANPLKNIAHEVHTKVGTVPLVLAGLGLSIYLARKILIYSLWRPRPERAFAKELIERNSVAIDAFLKKPGHSFNILTETSNGSPNKQTRIAFRGGISDLGTQRCTMLGLLTVEGHSLPVALKRSPSDIKKYRDLLETHPQISKFFPHLYGIIGDYIITERLWGLEDKSLERLAAGSSRSRKQYISKAWALVRSVYQQGLRFEYDVDIEQGSNLIFDPKTREVYLIELGSLKVSSGVPQNALKRFLETDYYGLTAFPRPFNKFDFALIEEALSQQPSDEAPFTLNCFRVQNEDRTVRMYAPDIDLYWAFMKGKIHSYGRVAISVSPISHPRTPKDSQDTALIVPLNDVYFIRENFFHLSLR